MSDALETFHRALLQFGAGAVDEARGLATRAARNDPGCRVFAEAARYLDTVRQRGRRGVYVEPASFSAFIRGGSNRTLYEATSARLRRVYRECPRAALLDLGVGDGLALLPALDDHVASVTLVEPSLAMLQTTVHALQERGVACEGFNVTAQAFVRESAAGRRWDIAQATFSMQSIVSSERGAIWAGLRERAARLLVVEFDVPRFVSSLDRDHVRSVLARYEVGLSEYTDDDGLVAQGFLMPVMFGYFDPTAARTNYEQPIDAWRTELESAGYSNIDVETVADYWWAPAKMLHAR